MSQPVGLAFLLASLLACPGRAATRQTPTGAQPGVPSVPPVSAPVVTGLDAAAIPGPVAILPTDAVKGTVPGMAAASAAVPASISATPVDKLIPAATAGGLLPVKRKAPRARKGMAPARARPLPSVLSRLAEEFPSAAPKDEADLDGWRSHSEDEFAFRLGAAESPGAVLAAAGSESAASPPAKPLPGAPGGADDGGGPDYPRETVRFRGKSFPSVALRPNLPVEPLLIEMIDAAKTSIHLSLYEFKQKGVLEALRRAQDRGVEVHIILDDANVFPRYDPDSDYNPKRSREIWALLREGFDVRVVRGLGAYGIMHNKFAVIDYNEGDEPMMAEYGSYNWSWTAEEAHYENANFTVEKKRVRALMAYWKWLEAQSVEAGKAKDHQWPTSLPEPPVLPEDIRFHKAALPALVFSPNRTPGRSTEDYLVKAIDASETSIDISIFALRSTRIADALKRARDERKVAVRMIMDRGQAASDAFSAYANWLAFHGIAVRTLAGPDPGAEFQLAQKMHHKFAVFDGELVETGSANYTKYAAAANFENAQFVKRAKTAAAFLFAFERMWARAEVLAAPAAAPALPTDAELAAETEKPPLPPAPRPPLPEPPSPRPAARQVAWAGKTFPSYAFRPDTPIEPMIVEMVRSAKKSVRLSLYEFNLESVLEALRWLKANRPEVKIELVVDRSHVYTRGRDSKRRPRKPSAQLQALIAEGFDLLLLKGEKSGIMHSKYLVVDGEAGGIVVTGSWNFARTAEDNHYENVVVSTEKGDVADYVNDFKYKRDLAEAVDPDKLAQTLAGTLSTEDAGDDAAAEAAADLERDSKFPPPPANPDTPFELNGERFQRTYFSPQGGIKDAWLRAIKASKTSIEIAMFGFYSRDIAEAIVAAVAEKRKENPEYRARLVLDAGQSTLAKLDETPVNQWFAQRGIDVRVIAGPDPWEGDPMLEKMHSKYIIVDRKLLITGSYNLSDTAENHSFENATVIMDPADLAGYIWDFERLYLRGWLPRGAAGSLPPPDKEPSAMPGA